MSFFHCHCTSQCSWGTEKSLTACPDWFPVQLWDGYWKHLTTKPLTEWKMKQRVWTSQVCIRAYCPWYLYQCGSHYVLTEALETSWHLFSCANAISVRRIPGYMWSIWSISLSLSLSVSACPCCACTVACHHLTFLLTCWFAIKMLPCVKSTGWRSLTWLLIEDWVVYNTYCELVPLIG